jgi:geranylgeranyl transferase type-1 subunit beta
VSRQTAYEESDGESDEEEDPHRAAREKLAGVYDYDAEAKAKEDLPADDFILDSQWVGFNGRCNKNVDTCYCFWVGASLEVCLNFVFISILLIAHRCWITQSS